MLRNFTKFWFPVLLYSAIIFYVSNQASLDSGLTLPYIDKVFHLGEYALYGMLVYRAVSHSFAWTDKKHHIILAFLCSVIFAVSDEWHQSYVPGRDASFADVFADILGVGIGIYGYLLYSKKAKNSK